jgi:hypothetical protein
MCPGCSGANFDDGGGLRLSRRTSRKDSHDVNETGSREKAGVSWGNARRRTAITLAALSLGGGFVAAGVVVMNGTAPDDSSVARGSTWTVVTPPPLDYA